MTTEKNHYTPNEYISADASDSDMINAAIVAAAEAGCGIVKIPLYNKRRGKNLWVIDKTIMIPSHTRVILDGCRLEMATACTRRCLQIRKHSRQTAGVMKASKRIFISKGAAGR